MTLLVRRRALLAFTVFVVVAVIAVAAYQYRAITATTSGALTAKVAAERVLFISLLLAGAVVAAGAALVIRAVRLTSILDKLVNMNKMSGFSPERALAKLGEVGERINELYRQTADLSAKKTQKIGGLSALAEYLVSVTDRALLVADPNGRVLYASKPLVERVGESRDTLVGRSLAELLPNANVSEAFQALRRGRAAVPLAGVAGDFTLEPILGPDGEAHYVVAEPPKAVADQMKPSAPSRPRAAAQGSARSRLFNVLPKLFRRRGKG